MTKSKESKPEMKIADTWLKEDFPDSPPEVQITCHFDLYHDGDWTHAIRAAIIGLENDIPVEQWEWAKDEVVAELRRSIELEPLPKPRPRGRHARGHGWIDYMNQLSVVACWDGAADLGLIGQDHNKVVRLTLNREGVPVSTADSLDSTYSQCHEKMQQESLYSTYIWVWQDAVVETLEARKG